MRELYRLHEEKERVMTEARRKNWGNRVGRSLGHNSRKTFLRN